MEEVVGRALWDRLRNGVTETRPHAHVVLQLHVPTAGSRDDLPDRRQLAPCVLLRVQHDVVDLIRRDKNREITVQLL